MLVQAQVRDELLQLAVLVLELLDPPQLADAQPAIHLLPAIEGLLRYAHKADDLRHRRARLRLLQRKGDLLFRVPRLLRVPAPCPQASKVGKLSFSMDEKTGRTSAPSPPVTQPHLNPASYVIGPESSCAKVAVGVEVL